MIPEIIHLSPLLLAGLNFFGDPFQEADGWSEENAIGRLWQRFMRLSEFSQAELNARKIGDFAYEVHIETPETPISGAYEVFVGVQVESLFDDIPHLVFKQLPNTKYALFTLKGKEINGNWTEIIFEDWLKTSPYESSAPYIIERYDERFKGIDQIDESIIDVLVPIKERIG